MAYYLDQGRSNYLPWTPLRFYDWMKSKISGFNILSTATVASCCAMLGGKSYIFFPGVTSEATRQYHLTLRGVFSNTALLGHEARHVDGYLHNSCCGIANGCDTAYDETNLSTYGIQFYMHSLLLTGDWSLNIECLDPAQLGSLGAFQFGDANSFASRFCTVKPLALAADSLRTSVCTPGPYPYISVGGIANAASFKTDAIAPGSLVSLFGLNLATTSDAATALPRSIKVTNVTVEMSGKAAPLWSVNAPTPSTLAQVNAQVPYEIPVGLANMRVSADGNVGFRRQFRVTSTGPGIFNYGANHAVLFDQDGQVNSAGSPAAAGSYVALYFTGQGTLPIPLASGAGVPLDPLIHAVGPTAI